MLMFSVLWLVPVVAALWALVTLQRMRTSQQAIEDRLNAVEQSLKAR